MTIASTIAVIAFAVTIPKLNLTKDSPVTLDELVKEYERFELPFPPAGSKFIIYESNAAMQFSRNRKRSWSRMPRSIGGQRLISFR
jgi:hypothetical protein